MTLTYSNVERHPLLTAFFRSQFPDHSVPLDIAAGDEMYSYALDYHHGDRSQALISYFRSGLSAFTSLTQILQWYFGSLAEVPKLLDFGSGFGRVTRYLAAGMDPRCLWVSDIVPQAMAFQEAHYRVHTIQSTPEPATLHLSDKFPCIVALSLFTHLPETLFRKWLLKLYSLVADDGLLLFSVHDRELLPHAQRETAHFHYSPTSESRTLQSGIYGTTWVSETYVTRVLEQIAPGKPWSRIPRGLWHLQDIYVISKSNLVDFSSLRFKRGPEGYVDYYDQLAPDAAEIAGWAVNHDGDVQSLRVEVSINDLSMGVLSPSLPRPDVAAALGRSRFTLSGWKLQCVAPHSTFTPTDIVLVKAQAPGGPDFLLHLSTLEGLSLYLTLSRAVERTKVALHNAANLQHSNDSLSQQVLDLRRRITAMEASRFWKVRNAWWKLKKNLLRHTDHLN